MDTSEINIKMVDCPEIQGQRDGTTPETEWLEGDYLCQQLVTGPEFKVFTEYEWEHEAWFGSYLWLPSQGQLQKMVRGDTHCHYLLWQVALWCHGGHDEAGRIQPGHDTGVDADESMEQLWLAFVMKELHDKTWNGQGWICGA